MKIKDLCFAAGRTGFFFDDQLAIKRGAGQDGFDYVGTPSTPGFSRIRQPGEAISVMIVLEDGQIACGDCSAVQYSGAGGRDPIFLAQHYIPCLETHVCPLLVGQSVTNFRELATKIDTLLVHDQPLHTALRYGLSQALLGAVALTQHRLEVEVLADEYDLPLIAERIPIFGQSGDDRYLAVDKMLLKEVDVLPHALMNNIASKIGQQGEKLLDYVTWLRQRVEELRIRPEYSPQLHIDVYGNLGPLWDHDPEQIAVYLGDLEQRADGLGLWIEGPVDMGAKPAQIEMLAAIKDQLTQYGCNVGIVADEWCNTYEDVREFVDNRCCHMVQIKTPDLGSLHNTVESVLYSRKQGVAAYQGGTCNETDVAARHCVHVALAARADRMLAKPGMGFDEGYAIVHNEMERTVTLMKRKQV